MRELRLPGGDPSRVVKVGKQRGAGLKLAGRQGCHTFGKDTHELGSPDGISYRRGFVGFINRVHLSEAARQAVEYLIRDIWHYTRTARGLHSPIENEPVGHTLLNAPVNPLLFPRAAVVFGSSVQRILAVGDIM